MAETTDDPVASWNERIGSLRKRGRVSSAALSVVPQDEVDVRRGRPSAPEQLSASERGLWERLVFARRPNWFSGAEELLASYCIMVTQLQQIEAALRKTKAGTGERYMKLARMHREALMLTVSLATKLKLSPSTRLDRRTPQDGDLPVG